MNIKDSVRLTHFSEYDGPPWDGPTTAIVEAGIAWFHQHYERSHASESTLRNEFADYVLQAHTRGAIGMAWFFQGCAICGHKDPPLRTILFASSRIQDRLDKMVLVGLVCPHHRQRFEEGSLGLPEAEPVVLDRILIP